MKEQEIAAWIGVDWADEEHEVCEYEVESGQKRSYSIKQTAESLQEWVGQLRSRHRTGRVAVVLEQTRGGLIYALMSTDFIQIYPVKSEIIGEIPGGTLSQRSQKRPWRCRTVRRNGSSESGTVSIVETWR